jgi:peptidoglycan/xylan/chitin deacetylase (PgdA/CDA1 family)
MDIVFPSVAVAVCAGLCVAPMIARYADEARVARLCARRRALVLTYDDGPTPRQTSAILDLLQAHGAHASFFVLGQKAERDAAVVDRAARDGHEIGSHSYSHVHAWKSWPWSAASDVARGCRAIERWGARRALFRPPYGKLTPLTWLVARLRGVRFAWWTLDSGDTWDALPTVESVVEAARRAKGGVVLMHDLDGDEERSRFVLELTEQLLVMAREEGLRVVRFSELSAEAAQT